LGRVDPSKIGVEVSFGGMNVFRRRVQVKKTAFEGSAGGKQSFKTDLQGSGNDVDVLLEGSTST
jgi:hypothetical protein